MATVGSSKTPFDRLVKAVDQLASETSEEVIIQKGISSYIPKTAKYFDFCDPDQMNSLIEQANLIITHAGFGIIADCIRFCKRMILIPREHQFGDAEGIQIELAEYLAKNWEGISCVRDVSLLKNAFFKISNTIPDYHFTSKIPHIIQKFIYQRLT